MQDTTGSIWQCPLCRSDLRPSASQGSWSCSSGHSFDTAREGYLHLLPVQKRKSRTPGDSKAMMQARRRFLEGGYYRPLTDALNRHIPATGRLLDLGCGEGYYSRQIRRQADPPAIFACDISKDAVRLCARGLDAAHSAVASSFDLPVKPASLEAVLTVFAPVKFAELARILKPGGVFIRVSPGAGHLLQIRRQLYEQIKTDTGTAAAPEPFRLIADENVRFDFLPEDRQAMMALLAMTPHYWKARAEKKQQLENQPPFSVSADFVLQVWQRD
ncbi:methyltransferase domain-containing protein [Granulosicoccaceae sp. 1_MG-2023]|nr:methyltransferase domain-containing protein [Granulosicoccaceae sp. 1_MG-2023]